MKNCANNTDKVLTFDETVISFFKNSSSLALLKNSEKNLKKNLIKKIFNFN